MTSRIKLFWENAKQELRRVNWPSWIETRHLTLIVIGFALFMAVYLGILDYIFTYVLTTFFI